MPIEKQSEQQLIISTNSPAYANGQVGEIELVHFSYLQKSSLWTQRLFELTEGESHLSNLLSRKKLSSTAPILIFRPQIYYLETTTHFPETFESFRARVFEEDYDASDFALLLKNMSIQAIRVSARESAFTYKLTDHKPYAFVLCDPDAQLLAIAKLRYLSLYRLYVRKCLFEFTNLDPMDIDVMKRFVTPSPEAKLAVSVSPKQQQEVTSPIASPRVTNTLAIVEALDIPPEKLAVPKNLPQDIPVTAEPAKDKKPGNQVIEEYFPKPPIPPIPETDCEMLSSPVQEQEDTGAWLVL